MGFFIYLTFFIHPFWYKDVEEPNEKKRFSIMYQRTKILKMGSPKIELANYTKWKPKTISLYTMLCLIR